MRTLACILALAAAVFAVAKEEPWTYSLEDTFGKTEAQILTMGRAKWNEFTSSQPGGSSTAGMCMTEAAFGLALRRSNDRFIVKLAPARRKQIADLRQPMAKFNEACIMIGSTFSGGGTMWHPVHAGIQADVEEIVQAFVKRGSKPAPKRVASDISKELDKLSVVLKQNQSELDDFKGSGFGFEVGMKALREARAEFAKIVAIAKGMPRAESDRLLQYCLDCLKVVDPFESE